MAVTVVSQMEPARYKLVSQMANGQIEPAHYRSDRTSTLYINRFVMQGYSTTVVQNQYVPYKTA